MRRSLLIIAAAMALTGCDTVDNRRLPTPYVHLVFNTQSDWVVHGVSGAGTYKYFNKDKRLPANFPYTAASLTGTGGVLLCTTFLGEPVAYDAACPVECRGDIIVKVNADLLAECQRCHSCYDIFSLGGAPVSGEAARQGYGMQTYRVTPGRQGEYMTVY